VYQPDRNGVCVRAVVMTPGESQLCESLPTVESDRTASLSPWQFSLRDIFWLTTAAAGVAAVAAVKGAGSLVISIGLVVAWLNARGRLAPADDARNQVLGL